MCQKTWQHWLYIVSVRTYQLIFMFLSMSSPSQVIALQNPILKEYQDGNNINRVQTVGVEPHKRFNSRRGPVAISLAQQTQYRVFRSPVNLSSRLLQRRCVFSASSHCSEGLLAVLSSHMSAIYYEETKPTVWVCISVSRSPNDLAHSVCVQFVFIIYLCCSVCLDQIVI